MNRAKYFMQVSCMGNLMAAEGRTEYIGFDGRNLVYRPLQVLTKVKTRIKQFYFRDGR